jgi:hypothetical protein
VSGVQARREAVGGTAAPGPDAYDATPYLPKRGGLPAHRRAAAECRGCSLFENATRTVFGKGASTARIVLVVVALGATAGKALFGQSFRVTKDSGILVPPA